MFVFPRSWFEFESFVLQNFSDDGKCGESNWRAAGNKGKRKSRLDETGLEIAGCRHAIAQWAVNMFRGEIYGYSNYIHVHKMIPNNVKYIWQDIICKYYIWQDIICKYWKWAVKASKSDESNAHEIKPALSVMHAKAHNWTCQVHWYCGRTVAKGSAYSTGEEVEQINSYLSRLANTTKYMLPESREELITEHALAWNKRKICDLSSSLCKRYAKYIEAQENTRKELDEMVSGVNLSPNHVDFLQWKSEVQRIAKEMESSFFTYLAEEEELYVLTSSLTDTSLLTSNVNISCVETEDYLSALSKKIIQRYSTVEDKRKRVKSLTAKLCRDITADVLLDRGKKLFLESALKCLKNELEML
ncbi:uncharacterized protein LOC124456337 [Xenia sp. Carnegie-2017]|uniref:uncharacterized protein LOC124456337 n=1 Tax=Xenia sp. Carnegie-2017 TaxID=2897299 RepID=UPI001F0425F4|nr:uncharacterized protein LOC124456337 [Xenia sp. Carnegie-2017]